MEKIWLLIGLVIDEVGFGVDWYVSLVSLSGDFIVYGVVVIVWW